MLNADQRHVFDTIHNHLLHQQQHETNGCSCENFLALMSGSVIAHGSSDAHILLIKAFIVPIRNNLPVPATPLRNIDWQHHWETYEVIWTSNFRCMYSKLRLDTIDTSCTITNFTFWRVSVDDKFDELCLAFLTVQLLSCSTYVYLQFHPPHQYTLVYFRKEIA